MSKSLLNITRGLKANRIDQLSSHDLALLESLSTAHDLIIHYGPGYQTAKMISAKCQVALSTAYEYINEAQILFGSTRIANKKFNRGVLTDRVLKMMSALENSIYQPAVEKDEDGKDIVVADDQSSKILAVRNDFNTPMLIGQYVKLVKELSALLELHIPDAPDNPKDTFIMPVFTGDITVAGFKKKAKMSDLFKQKMIELGADFDDDGNAK